MKLDLTPAQLAYVETLVDQDEEGAAYVAQGHDGESSIADAKRELKLARQVLKKLAAARAHPIQTTLT